jgi:hypothetical protein
MDIKEYVIRSFIETFLAGGRKMKGIILFLVLLALLCGSSYAQTTLYDGWISFTSNYLGSNEYEYTYIWGASTALNQDEIDGLFPYESGWYRRESAGIGTHDFGFSIDWENPVDIEFLYPSVDHSCYYSDPFNHQTHKSVIGIGNVMGMWYDHYAWNEGTEFSFRTLGEIGTQSIGLDIDYYAKYSLLPEYAGQDRPGICTLAMTPLRVTGTFGPVPELPTLFLLGPGLFSWAMFNRLKLRKKI